MSNKHKNFSKPFETRETKVQTVMTSATLHIKKRRHDDGIRGKLIN